jgi:hypothetical protein
MAQLTFFSCKFITTTTSSKMDPIGFAIALLNAQDFPNYIAAARLFGVGHRTLHRRFLGLTASQAAARTEHHQLLNAAEEKILLDYIDKNDNSKVPPPSPTEYSDRSQPGHGAARAAAIEKLACGLHPPQQRQKSDSLTLSAYPRLLTLLS